MSDEVFHVFQIEVFLSKLSLAPPAAATLGQPHPSALNSVEQFELSMSHVDALRVKVRPRGMPGRLGSDIEDDEGLRTCKALKHIEGLTFTIEGL